MNAGSLCAQRGTARPLACREEAEVIALAKAGDDCAFAELVHRNYSNSLRLACSMVTNIATAQDAVASTFCIALEHLDQFEAGKFSFWLNRILMNECYASYRRAQRWSPVEFEEKAYIPEGRPESWHTLTPEEQLNRSEFAALLSREIARIPVLLRLPLLKRTNGQSMEEIAADMGISESAVKARLHRARILLKHRVSRHLIRHSVHSLSHVGR
jgi:RNA polymerase sigma-70 factor, ECF subfamily